MKKICLIMFSNNADLLNVIYSMYYALQGKADLYTIGINNPKSHISPLTDRNLYFENLHVWNILLMWMCSKCIRVEAIYNVVPHDMSKTMVMCTKLVCKDADHVVLRNDKYKQLLSDEYNLPMSKIICFALWWYFPEEGKRTHSGKLLSFGCIRKFKGLDKLEEISRETPDVPHQIFGESDEESKLTVEILKKNNNVEMDDLEGTDQEMIDYFHNADWIVLPYTSAMQSGVIADSYRPYRSVIAINVGAISEKVENGVTIFLMDADDGAAFTEAVKKAAAISSEETDQFAHSVYSKDFYKYAVEAVADKFVEALTEIEGYCNRAVWIFFSSTTDYSIGTSTASFDRYEVAA